MRDTDTDLELDDEIEAIEAEDGKAESEEDDADDDDDEEDEDEDGGTDDEEPELIVTIGDEEPEEDEKAPEWVRDLRRENAAKAKRIKELEAQVNGGQGAEAATLRAKPTLADHDYDDAAFEADLDKWYQEKRDDDVRQAEVQEQQEAETKRWQAKLAAFEEGKKALKVSDLDVAEEVVTSMFNHIQLGIVVEAAKNPALVFYALGKNPKRAKEVAAINNPIEFARAVFEMEGQLKVTDRKKPAPEKTVRRGGTGGVTDNTLEKLRAEAERTNDYSKVQAYKRKLKAKAR